MGLGSCIPKRSEIVIMYTYISRYINIYTFSIWVFYLVRATVSGVR